MNTAFVEVLVNGERHKFEHQNAYASPHSFVGVYVPHEIRVSVGERFICYPICNVIRYWNVES